MKLKNTTIKRTFAHHRDKPSLYPLRRGGAVVGHEVDSDNRLVYVIRDQNSSLRLAYASDEPAVMQLPPPQFHQTVVPVRLPTVDKKPLQ